MHLPRLAHAGEPVKSLQVVGELRPTVAGKPNNGDRRIPQTLKSFGVPISEWQRKRLMRQPQSLGHVH
jgi:hypothetical protein